MRARNIKPGFFKNEELGALLPIDRVLFAGLWCIADRAGRLEDRPRRIKAEILPWDDRDVNAALDELCRAGFILRYEKGGKGYIQILSFAKHQNPHFREAESIIPPPEGFGEEEPQPRTPKKRGRKPKSEKEKAKNEKNDAKNSKNISEIAKKISEKLSENSPEKNEISAKKKGTEFVPKKSEKSPLSSQKLAVDKPAEKNRARGLPGESRADSLIPDSLIPDSGFSDTGLSDTAREVRCVPPAAINPPTGAGGGKGKFCGYSGQRLYDIKALEKAFVNAGEERENDS